MAKKSRIKAKEKKGITTAKVMANHAMLSYDEAKRASKKAGKDVPANFITSMKAEVDGELVYEVSTSQFLSKNPFVQFKFKGSNKGKQLVFTWTDKLGKSRTDKKKIK
ncbi:MAG: thiosulfate oxidation carrier complex protein SoxZ [Campylobacterota bacterium]|nr:thiosulfate oxidation carrier complex protein SoxZ [Campylobacterota bacterium]